MRSVTSRVAALPIASCSSPRTWSVMCAAAWDGVTRNLAQKIAGKNRGEHLKRRHWQAFAAEVGLNPSALVLRVGDLARKVLAETKTAAAAVAAMPAGDHVLMPRFVEAIEARARAVLSGLDEVEPQSAAVPLAAATPAATDALGVTSQPLPTPAKPQQKPRRKPKASA